MEPKNKQKQRKGNFKLQKSENGQRTNHSARNELVDPSVESPVPEMQAMSLHEPCHAEKSIKEVIFSQGPAQNGARSDSQPEKPPGLEIRPRKVTEHRLGPRTTPKAELNPKSEEQVHLLSLLRGVQQQKEQQRRSEPTSGTVDPTQKISHSANPVGETAQGSEAPLVSNSQSAQVLLSILRPQQQVPQFPPGLGRFEPKESVAAFAVNIADFTSEGAQKETGRGEAEPHKEPGDVRPPRQKQQRELKSPRAARQPGPISLEPEHVVPVPTTSERHSEGVEDRKKSKARKGPRDTAALPRGPRSVDASKQTLTTHSAVDADGPASATNAPPATEGQDSLTEVSTQPLVDSGAGADAILKDEKGESASGVGVGDATASTSGDAGPTETEVQPADVRRHGQGIEGSDGSQASECSAPVDTSSSSASDPSAQSPYHLPPHPLAPHPHHSGLPFPYPHPHPHPHYAPPDLGSMHGPPPHPLDYPLVHPFAHPHFQGPPADRSLQSTGQYGPSGPPHSSSHSSTQHTEQRQDQDQEGRHREPVDEGHGHGYGAGYGRPLNPPIPPYGMYPVHGLPHPFYMGPGPPGHPMMHPNFHMPFSPFPLPWEYGMAPPPYPEARMREQQQHERLLMEHQHQLARGSEAVEYHRHSQGHVHEMETQGSDLATAEERDVDVDGIKRHAHQAPTLLSDHADSSSAAAVGPQHPHRLPSASDERDRSAPLDSYTTLRPVPSDDLAALLPPHLQLSAPPDGAEQLRDVANRSEDAGESDYLSLGQHAPSQLFNYQQDQRHRASPGLTIENHSTSIFGPPFTTHMNVQDRNAHMLFPPGMPSSSSPLGLGLDFGLGSSMGTSGAPLALAPHINEVAVDHFSNADGEQRFRRTPEPRGHNGQGGAEINGQGDAGGGVADPTPAPADAPGGPQRFAFLQRVVRNQPGHITVSHGRRNARSGETGPELREGFSIRPGQNLMISWRLPIEVFEQTEHTHLVVGLVRHGSSTNLPCIVTKSLGVLGKGPKVVSDMFGNALVEGSITFHTPKASGRFVFRMFDDTKVKEKSAITLATSVSFLVELVDFDVTNNLKFCVDAFAERVTTKNLAQFSSVVACFKSYSRSSSREELYNLMQECVEHVLDTVEDTVKTLDAGRERAAADKADANGERSKPEAGAEAIPGKEQLAADAFWAMVRSATKMHSECVECIRAVQKNELAWSVVSRAQQGTINSLEQRYCPLLQRYFESRESLESARRSMFGFLPTPSDAIVASPSSGGGARPSPTVVTTEWASMLQALNHSIVDALPSLFPSRDFESKREDARSRIEETLLRHGAVPGGTTLVLYGSSCNSFGTDGADLDMCLSFPSGMNPSMGERGAILEHIGVILMEMGMEEVSVRSTARIPIVTFKDSFTGLDCDISFYNPLALCNTRLLSTYSVADPRVRPLAFIIKHWAKSRHMNCPAEGTLSSYGFLLCLIHFLQTRPIPVLPNLQRLPPVWTGGLMPRDAPLPNTHEVELHPVDSTPCMTYFYSPFSATSPTSSSTAASAEKVTALKNYGKRNKESCAELLVGFFRYFAWEFNYKQSVVSIHSPSGISLKQNKAEIDNWILHERLSIEDPFEVWYDVAHVIKGAQMLHIRKEFLRAYTLISRACAAGGIDSLPSTIHPSGLLGKLCERGDPPPFTSLAKESLRGRANTGTSELDQATLDDET